MATPETRSVELDPTAPSFDEDPNVVESEENQVLEAETRELPAYSFESSDKTLVGIGSSDSANSSAVRPFDSSDQTLVGIGPAERARRAQLAQDAELSIHSQQAGSDPAQARERRELCAESAPESIPMPYSEPPGPFVASDDDEDAPNRLPVKKGEPWVLALSAVLVAAAAVALLRGVVPYSPAPRLHSAANVAPLPTPDDARTRYVQFETAAATVAETFAVAIPTAQAPEAPAPAAPPAAAQRGEQPELAPRRVTASSAVGEPLGALDVTSNPPAGLVLDGRPVGKAPRIIQVPSGPHTVLFVHPERGRVSVTVNVRAGRTTSASADF
jgi:hypothetical protein